MDLSFSIGCDIYAFSGFFGGFASMMNVTALAVCRFIMMCLPDKSKYKRTIRGFARMYNYKVFYASEVKVHMSCPLDVSYSMYIIVFTINFA